MSVEEQLSQLITQVLPIELQDLRIHLEKPTNNEFGDYACNIAMTGYPAVKTEFASPRHLAEYIVNAVVVADQQRLLKTATVAGPGFINLTLQEEYLFEHLAQILQKPENLIHQFGQEKKVIVEYSSPNIAKPFTIGHFRSTIIGDCIARLLSASGFTVFRDNHLGDWGTQFGKQIVAIKKWGDEATIAASAHPVNELVALYVKFHEEAEKDPSLEDEGRAWFKKLESGDPEARRVWQLCIQWSLTEFKKIYTRLGVSFTENPENGYFGYGESYFEGMLTDVIKELQAKGIAHEGQEGAILVFFPSEQLPPLMIQKKDGATLYATRDLAADRWRKNNPRYENADGSAPLIINEVGAEQALYFQQLYQTEQLLGWFKPAQRIHVKHGLFRFKEGKMSTRKGNVIWLTDVLDKAEAKAQTFSTDQHIAQQVSISALKWNDLKRRSDLAIQFDWDELLNLQGNSGPYMQYSYARAMSVLRKAESASLSIDRQVQPQSVQAEERQLLGDLYQFGNVLETATRQYAPYLLCNYLYSLAQTFNSFYNKYPILKDSPERQFRLQLTQAVALIIEKGLLVLGMTPLEKM